jgi:electron transfer flavoprotein alpha subunit
MRILTVVESAASGPDGDTVALLAHVATLTEDSVAVVFGSGLSQAAIDSVGETGVARILVADGPEFESARTAARVATIQELLGREPVDAILFAPSLVAPELAGALGATLDAGVSWGLTDLSIEASSLKAIRHVSDDSELVDITWRQGPPLAVFRSFGKEAAPVAQHATIEQIPSVPASDLPRIVKQEWAPTATSGARLEDARIIVAGGRGAGSPEGLDLVRQLAETMGAAFGVSLPVVDMGWATRDRQVGQTGTVVAPELYIACGISGQIQHRLGIARSRYIVAINNDPDAPIMRWADLAIVGDLHTLLPKLVDEVSQAVPN